jgi:hypothetical protein
VTDKDDDSGAGAGPSPRQRKIIHVDMDAFYVRWHMFEEKREAVMAIEATVALLNPRSRLG